MRKWLGIVLAVVLGGAAWVSAHTVTIGDADLTDWDPAGWSMDRPTNLNTGHIARDGTHSGEYIWNDFLDDERTGGLAYPYPRLDIDEFRITSDSSYLYFLVRMNQINPGDWGVHGSPMVQIAIDLDPNWTGVTENGLGEFWSDQEATVAPEALWDYLVVTRFGSDSPQPYVFFWNDPWVDYSTAQAREVITPGPDNSIEIEIPWSVIGGIPTVPLTFTVVTYQSDVTDQVIPLPGPAPIADVMDAVTNYTNPGDWSTTDVETADGVVDYHFEVWFHLDPDTEPSPPLVVSEVMYYNVTVYREFIEVFNRTGIDGFNISRYKVGDEETVNMVEGMAVFPDYPIGSTSTIGLCDVVVMANSGFDFFTKYGFDADFELYDPDDMYPTENMNPEGYAAWTTGWTYDFILDDGQDEVLLLDNFDTVIDVVAWGSTVYPGVLVYPGVTTGSIERTQQREDSNDCTLDIDNQDPETPGQVACQVTSNECRLTTWDPATCCYARAGVTCNDLSPADCYDSRCNGTGSCVQTYTFELSDYLCRASTGACDVAEYCSGTYGSCPPNGYASSTVECRPAAGVCDLAENCSGSSADCPGDLYHPPTTECRPAAGICDAVEYCTGSSADCPGDAREPATFECRPGAGECDVPEYCDGSSVECPEDYVEPATTICREAVDICDVAEYCTGTTAACPPDAFESNTTLCRTATGICDLAEYCHGTTSTCPVDMFESPSTYCREATGPCDVMEYCTGVSADCPVDLFEPVMTPCEDGDECTVGESCDENGVCGGGINICDLGDDGWLFGCDGCSVAGNATPSAHPASLFLIFGIMGLALKRMRR